MAYGHDENRAPSNGTVVIDMTGEDRPVLLAEEKEEGAECSNLLFCGVCLQKLEDVNFLLRIKHVKECCRLYGSGKVSEKMVSGQRALKLFLEYHGCIEYYDKFIDSNIVKDLDHVHGMGSHELRRLHSIVGGRKKLELALEHYALHGRLPLRASLLARSGSEKSNKTVKRMKSNKNISLMGRQKQQQQKNEAASNGTVCPSGGLTGRNPRHNTLDCTSRLRRVERMLFVSFYEDTCENDTRQCGSSRMTLNHQSVVYRNNNGHVTQDESMWVGAGCCGFELRSGSLERRLALKRGDVREGRGVGNRAQQESIAVKKVRLKAMEDELQVQLSTVKELEDMIGSLKKEIDELENTVR